jgi:hypothetical protein
MRVSNLADQVGIKAIMVHAIDERAKAFYEYFGFVQSPVAANTLFYKIYGLMQVFICRTHGPEITFNAGSPAFFLSD